MLSDTVFLLAPNYRPVYKSPASADRIAGQRKPMFDLEQYLAGRRALVDAALDAAIPPESAPPMVLHKAMRYSVFSGGKRLRPILCLAAAEAVAGDMPADAMAPAVAVELFHTFTLIHDDLPSMDDDDMRRGRPTCHKMFGEANAVLAGDALQALAFEVVARSSAAPPYSANQLVIELAGAAGSRGVVGGQVEDLLAGAHPTGEQIRFIHLHKTADLFYASARMGAMVASASPEALGMLSKFATAIGLAFQMADDLLDADDVAAGSAKPGASCLMVMSAGEARRQAFDLVRNALDHISPMAGSGAEALRAIARFTVERNY
jgi:geranylgeranyl diphosphate synthase type II